MRNILVQKKILNMSQLYKLLVSDKNGSKIVNEGNTVKWWKLSPKQIRDKKN